MGENNEIHRERNTVKVDLHVHSEGSYDCNEPIELILEHADDIGLEALAITDHDNIEKSLEAKELSKEYDVTVITGVEVSTKHGHLLALGITEMPDVGKPFMETVKQVRNMGGTAVVPHPFQKTRHGVSKRHIKDIDAVEVYNSWIFTGLRNRKAKKFARNRNLPETAASDAHSITMLGRAYTEINTSLIDGEVGQEEILKAIKNGGNHTNGRRKPMYQSAHHYTKAMMRKTAWFLKKTLYLPVKIEKKLFKKTIQK